MFPEYTVIKKSIFGFLDYKKFPDGWEDAGTVGEWNYARAEPQKGELHSFCNTYLRIGREEGRVFKYCPKCLVKTELYGRCEEDGSARHDTDG